MFTTIDSKVIESESNGVPHHTTVVSTELMPLKIRLQQFRGKIKTASTS